jgi:acetylornithine deacetylase
MTIKLPDLETMIAELVATPSVSSVQPALDMPNSPVCERLAGWLEHCGFDVELMAVPGRPGKTNLIGRYGRGRGGLVLSGHTDTVPFDDGRWTHDPFEVSRRDGRLYGLGTADMKAFLAIATRTAAAFAGRTLRAPLAILATADEESTMSGARALAERGQPPGRYVVIGEPTGMRPIHAHKGIMMEAIRVTGRSGHSSNPALGRSALDGMLTVAAELQRLREDFGARFRLPDFEVPEPTLNLGFIHGGDSPNRICAQCELHIDIRLNPGMTVAATRQLLRDRIRKCLSGSELTVDFDTLFAGVDPLRGADGPLLSACEHGTGSARGTVCFGTEGPFMQALGMETVIMGPGSIDQAHQPDEYLALSQADRCGRVLAGLIERFCVAGDDA